MAVDYYSETALLLAVRNRLRSQVTAFTTDTCQIEYDELAPATVGDLYVVVLPGGITPGPVHNRSGTVVDEIIGIDVSVIIRIPGYPRDRRREKFIDASASLNAHLADVRKQIDWSYTINDDALTLITAQTSSTEEFIIPLRFAGIEARPRLVPSEVFAAKPGETAAGLKRGIQFRGARRIQTI